jgi:exodeoxyribonuclease VII large subunit
VADLRAPTPSAAAELITEAQHKIAEHLATYSRRLERAARFQVLKARQQWSRLPVSRAESRVGALLRRVSQRLDDLSLRQEAALDGRIRRQQNRVAALAAAVLRNDPRQALAQARGRLQAYTARMNRSLDKTLQRAAARREAVDAQLNSLSPLAVLDRGYALVQGEDGSLIRSAAQLKEGDRVRTRLSEGAFTSRVEETAAATPAKDASRPKKAERTGKRKK